MAFALACPFSPSSLCESHQSLYMPTISPMHQHTKFSHHFTFCHLNSTRSAVSPTTIADKTLNDIESSAIIACLRAQNAELALEAARAALNAGVTVLEVVMSTPGVLEVLGQLVQEYPRRTIGVGTVLYPNDAKNAIKHGAKLVLSPAFLKDILDCVSHGDALYIPGAMTPTEVLLAFNAGAKMVKVYPISSLGGIEYISALKKPFPHIPMVASQGIQLDVIEEYISQGAASVVLSDAIFCKKAMMERNFEAIYQHSRTATLRAKKALERISL